MSKDDLPPEEPITATFIDCDISNNGTGAHLGSGNFKFINTKTNDNKVDGVVLGEGAKATFESHEAKGNGRAGIISLADAIKKPRANGNKGLKIIVGSIVLPLIIGVILYEYGAWRDTPSNQATNQASTPASLETQK
jgi:hypothetical protein